MTPFTGTRGLASTARERDGASFDPQLHLTDVLARIADHPARQITELLRWHWQPSDLSRTAAGAGAPAECLR
jgi:hypothetical protein